MDWPDQEGDMQPSTSKLLFSIQVRNEGKSVSDGFSDFMENCHSQNVLFNGVIQSRHFPQPSSSNGLQLGPILLSL